MDRLAAVRKKPLKLREWWELNLTLREMQATIFAPTRLVIYAAVAVILIVVSPFGTDKILSWPGRIGYWGVSTLLICFISDIVTRASNAFFTDDKPVHQIAANTVLTCLAVTTVIFLVNMSVWGSDPKVPGFFDLLLIVAPISLAVSCTIHFLIRNLRSQPDKKEVPFFKRLPHHLGTELSYLSMQDHYVEVVTSKGKEMLLMRFSDALAELEDYDGLQIHRSHWVSKEAVAGHKRIDGKLFLQMVDNTELPVSRSFQSQVKEELRF